MLGINAQPKVLADNRIEPLEAHGLKVISVGFLNPGDKPLIWRGPMLHSIIKQFLGSVVWGELDYLVVDLPPGTGDVALSLIQTVPLTGAIVVSTPSDVSLAGRAQSHRNVPPDEGGPGRHGRKHELLRLPATAIIRPIFSLAAARRRRPAQFGVAYLGDVQLDPDIRKASDSGQPTVLAGEGSASGKSLYDFARKVVTRVDEIKANAGESVIQIQ